MSFVRVLIIAPVLTLSAVAGATDPIVCQPHLVCDAGTCTSPEPFVVVDVQLCAGDAQCDPGFVCVPDPTFTVFGGFCEPGPSFAALGEACTAAD